MLNMRYILNLFANYPNICDDVNCDSGKRTEVESFKLKLKRPSHWPYFLQYFHHRKKSTFEQDHRSHSVKVADSASAKLHFYLRLIFDRCIRNESLSWNISSRKNLTFLSPMICVTLILHGHHHDANSSKKRSKFTHNNTICLNTKETFWWCCFFW